MLQRRFAAALASALAVSVLPPPAHAAPRPWRLSDLLAISFIGDVRISPDGTRVLYSRLDSDMARNTFKTTYYAANVAGGESLVLPADMGHPRFSPDGRHIAWIGSSAKATPHVVMTDIKGERRIDLSAGKRTVVAFAWSPDGSRLAAIETGGATQGGASRLRWMTDRNDFRNTASPQRTLWLIDTASGAQRQVVRDGWSYGGPATDHDPSWSADGKRIAVVRQPTPFYADFERAEYVAADVATGNVRSLVSGGFFAYPGSAPPAFAPSGSDVAYVHTWDGKLAAREDLFVGDRNVTASLDRDLWSCGAGGFAWSGRDLIVNVMDGLAMRLFRVSQIGGTPIALTAATQSVAAFSLARTGRIAFVASSPSTTSEVFVLDPGGMPRQVTHATSLPRGLSAAVTRFVVWPDGRGHTLHGQLTVPAASDLSKVPLVVEPHGGPQCADDASFSPLAQYFATNGYAYFRPDPSGSDGYGDWSYKTIVDNWGPGPMADDMAGIDSVLARGVGDSDKLYLEGASYGGYLTTWIVTHSNRFKAAVALVPPPDLLSEYALSESPNILRRFFGAHPAADPAKLAAESPLTYASALETPLLLIIGLRDTRAPDMGAIEFYKVLADRGAPARLLADPQSGHGPADPRGVMAWIAATAGWFVNHGAPPIPDAKLPQ